MKKWNDKRLLVNEDSDWWRTTEGWRRDPLRNIHSQEQGKEQIKKYFRNYYGHKITDVLLCIFCQVSYVPTKYITWAGDKALWTHENGIPVDDYGDWFTALYKAFTEFGLDPVALFIETMREGNIRPWISIRMNDCHCPEWETCFIRSEFFYEARENGWMIGSGGEDYGYYNYCFDYAQPVVREMMLNYIREMAERYDTDGIELDFMREIFCFDYRNNRECYQIMNDFMRQVRQIVNEAAAKKGHEILLMVRVHRSVEDSLAFGFDVKTWAEEGLVDAIVPSPRWEYTDSGIPVEDWKRLVGADIAVFPGVETLSLKFTKTTAKQVNAYAAGWYATGADGLYAYNMFYNDIPHMDERSMEVWKLTPENCLSGTREFLVTGQDIASGFHPAYRPLPMNLRETNTLPLVVGKIAATNPLTLLIDFEGEGVPEVTVSGIPADSVSEHPLVVLHDHDDEGSDKIMTEYQTLAYRFTGVESEKEIVLTFTGNGIVHYVNLQIENK